MNPRMKIIVSILLTIAVTAFVRASWISHGEARAFVTLGCWLIIVAFLVALFGDA